MNLEFFIRLRDMVSSGLAKVAQTAQKTNAMMKGGNDALGSSYDAIKRKVLDLESVISKSNSVKHIREARRELEALQRQQAKHPAHMGSGGGLGGMFRQALPMLGLAGALTLGGGMLNSGLEAQARQVSFEVMAGKEGGTRLNNNLTKYAQDSIYGNEVYQNAQTMLGFGLQEKDVMPSLKMLGDVAMGDANKLSSLTLAFSQVKAAGKLTGQDLLQFVNVGFNPLQTIAEKTGISMGALKDAVSDGKITFDMVDAAFKSATGSGGRFYDMTNKIAQTDYGKMQAFLGQLQGLGMKIGGLLAPAMGLFLSILEPVINLLGIGVSFIKDHSDAFAVLAGVVAGVAAVYGLYLLAVNGVVLATTLWTAAQTALNFVMSMNPIILVTALIAGLVAGIVVAWKKFEGFRMVVWGLWGSIKQVFENIGGFFKKIFEPIFEAIEAFKDGRIGDAGKAVAKLAYNLSPIGLAHSAAQYSLEGGFTKGVKDAYNNESLRGKNANTVSATQAGTPSSPDLSAAFAPLSGMKGKKGEGDESVRGITSGGPRVINIIGPKFAENFTIQAQNLDEGIDKANDKLEEWFLRLLNSGAAVQ